MLSVIIRPRSNVAGFDVHSRDTRVRKDNAEEGKAPQTRSDGDEAAEQQLAIDIEVLD